MSIKEKLQYFAEHGMSITYIAQQIGVNSSTLTKWLHNQKGITHKNENLVNDALKNITNDFLKVVEN